MIFVLNKYRVSDNYSVDTKVCPKPRLVIRLMFVLLKRLRIFLFPPEWDASLSQVTAIASTHLYSWVERSVFLKDTNTAATASIWSHVQTTWPSEHTKPLSLTPNSTSHYTRGAQTFFSGGQMKKSYEGRGPQATGKNNKINNVYDWLFYNILHC